MKKIYLNKIIQKNTIFYSMVADPRLIAKVRKKYTAGEKQDVQRPWIEKKVKEISFYVAGKSKVENKNAIGLIPNAPIINLKSKFKIEKEVIEYKENGNTVKRDLYYVMFPETDSEINDYDGQLEIIDGQHRIIAFDESYIDPDFDYNENYEMNFTVFENISDNERKELFMVTNEKQDKVESNLLRYIKKSLGLLIGDDDEIYDILEKINNESSSPLYKRIAFGADKVKKGYKENQLTKIIKLYGAKKFYDNIVVGYADKTGANPHNLFAQILNEYFTAWEEECNVSFAEPLDDTLTKISGVRYILASFAEIADILLSEKKQLNKANFLSVIKLFPKALNMENTKCIFCDDTVGGVDDETRKLAFRGETATVALAKGDMANLKTYRMETDEGITLI